MICKKCGRELKIDECTLLLSCPPKRKCECSQCGNINYIDDNIMIIKALKPEMKNKYQEVLNKIDDDLSNYKPDHCRVDLKLLQELVDKETPMKPEWLGGAMTGEPKPYCPKCSYCVNDTYLNKYRCRECNQKLDWSDE